MSELVKKTILLLSITLLSLKYNTTLACHAMGLLNPTVTVTATGIEVDADSDPATCGSGCGDPAYWLDIEVRCLGENFNPTAFGPGNYPPLFTYPFFQSDQMQKPSCVQKSYPTTFIPFSALCPGDYNIRFRENHNGETGGWSAPIQFTVPGTPPAVVGDITTAKDTVCAGECTVLSAGFTGGCGLAGSYSWSTGSSNAQINVCPTSDSIFTVDITELCGGNTTQESIEIIVVPAPEAGTVSASETEVCQNETVDLSLVNNEDVPQWQSAPSSTGPWTDIAGATSTNFTSPPITDNARCFRAKVEGCSSPVYSNEVCITVNDIPSITADNFSICEGESVDITTSVSNAGGDYLWELDGSTSATLSGQSPTDTTDYIVNYSLNGCSNSDTATVVVFKSPDAQFEVDSVCYLQATNFVDNSNLDNSNGDSIDQWLWSFGDGNTSIQQNTTHTYNAESEYSVKLVVTTNNGCRDSIIDETVVYPLPNVQFSATDECLGNDIQFLNNTTISNQFTPNSVMDNFWDFDDGNSSNEESPVHEYDSDGAYDVKLIATSDRGCVDSLTKTVTIHPKPDVDFTADLSTSCSPLCTEINSSSSVNSPSSIVSYSWIVDQNQVQSGSESTLVECFSNNSNNTLTHDVKLIVESNEGCVDSSSVDDFLTVYHNPLADFSFTPEYVDVIESEVEFTNLSEGEDSLNWTFGTFDQSHESNPVIEFPAVGGDYNVNLLVLTDEGCRDSVDVFINVDNRILYYAPNAFTPDGDAYNQEFKVVFPDGFVPEDFKLLIFNRWGEVVFESQNHMIGWDGTYGTDSGRRVEDGTYVWKVEFKDIQTDKKFTKTGHVTLMR